MKKYGIPLISYYQLLVQELAGAENRGEEVAVFGRNGKPLTYSRIYVGSYTTPDEKLALQNSLSTEKPHVSLIRFGTTLGTVPSYLLPLERILPKGSPIRQKLDNLRQNFLVMELGRTKFFRENAESDEELEKAKRIHFTQLYYAINRIATIHNFYLHQVALIVNTGKAGKRHYTNEYNFRHFSTPVEFDRSFSFDCLLVIEGEQNPYEIKDSPKCQLHYMETTAQDFFGRRSKENQLFPDFKIPVYDVSFGAEYFFLTPSYE